MHCKLCDTYYVHDIGFDRLFSKPAICPDCLAKIAVNHHVQVIPVSAGVIEYHTLHEDTAFIRVTELHLDFQYATLFRQLEKEKNKDIIVLFLNHKEYGMMADWLPFVNMGRKIIFFGQYAFDMTSFGEYL